MIDEQLHVTVEHGHCLMEDLLVDLEDLQTQRFPAAFTSNVVATHRPAAFVVERQLAQVGFGETGRQEVVVYLNPEFWRETHEVRSV